MLHLDESQSVSQVPVEAMTFLCSLQLILTLPCHRLQVLPACTANMPEKRESCELLTRNTLSPLRNQPRVKHINTKSKTALHTSSLGACASCDVGIIQSGQIFLSTPQN